MLRWMGADIEGDGTDLIVIHGVNDLKPARHSVISDRIETGTFMIAAAITGGEIKIEGCRPEHLTSLIEKLESAGAGVEVMNDAILVKGPAVVQSTDIMTRPYPGFPTDLQAQFMTLMCEIGRAHV